MRKSAILICLLLGVSCLFLFLGCESGKPSSSSSGSPSPNPTGTSSGQFSELATSLTNSYDIMVFNSFVYWSERTNPGRVARVQTAGGTVEQVATGLNLPTGITTDGTFIYICEYGGGTIRRKQISSIGSNTDSEEWVQATDGGQITNPLWIKYMSNGGRLFFTQFNASQGKVCSLDLSGNATDIRTDLNNPYGFDVDSTATLAFIAEMTGANNSQLLQINLGSGAVTELFQGGSLSYGTSVKYDGIQFVYWADYVQGSGVYRVDNTSSQPAQTIESVEQGSSMLAFDVFGPLSGKVYFSDNRSKVSGGTILSQSILDLNAAATDVIKSNADSPFKIVIQGNEIFWTEFPSFDPNFLDTGGSGNTRVCKFTLQ